MRSSRLTIHTVTRSCGRGVAPLPRIAGSKRSARWLWLSAPGIAQRELPGISTKRDGTAGHPSTQHMRRVGEPLYRFQAAACLLFLCEWGRWACDPLNKLDAFGRNAGLFKGNAIFWTGPSLQTNL